MKVIEIIFIVLAMSLGTSSCMMSNRIINASKEVEEREYHFGPVSNIDASTDVIIIIISPGYTENTITAKGSKNVLDALVLKDNGNSRLSVSLNHRERFIYRSENQKAHVYIASSQITHLICSSGAKIDVTDTIRCQNHFIMETLTGGSISFNGVISPAINAKAFTGGSIILKGIISEMLNAQAFTGGFISISGETKGLHTKGNEYLLDVDKLQIIN